ncbi:hypothetical protein CRUP_011238 [Coryphaenoides rupestris]|nr:hypothetical protein CRUP_011238 [Coryphaenoides rupestris]
MLVVMAAIGTEIKYDRPRHSTIGLSGRLPSHRGVGSEPPAPEGADVVCIVMVTRGVGTATTAGSKRFQMLPMGPRVRRGEENNIVCIEQRSEIFPIELPSLAPCWLGTTSALLVGASSGRGLGRAGLGQRALGSSVTSCLQIHIGPTWSALETFISFAKKLPCPDLYDVVEGYMKISMELVRLALCLLSSMVSQGAESAREVYAHFTFSQGLGRLARRRVKKGRPDIRMAYVQFAVSFLVSGDPATVGHILEVKELLPEILTSGISEDRLSVVSLILSTLKSRVVKNKAVTKTQKVRFFTAVLLADLATLYRWDGIVDASTEEDDDSAVCSSRKNGISFHDPSYGTAGRYGPLDTGHRHTVLDLSAFQQTFMGLSIVSEEGERGAVPPLLQHQGLHLALELPSSKFSWVSSTSTSTSFHSPIHIPLDPNAGETESSSGERPVLFLLLRMLVSSSSSQLRSLTKMLLLKRHITCRSSAFNTMTSAESAAGGTTHTAADRGRCYTASQRHANNNTLMKPVDVCELPRVSVDGFSPVLLVFFPFRSSLILCSRSSFLDSDCQLDTMAVMSGRTWTAGEKDV